MNGVCIPIEGSLLNFSTRFMRLPITVIMLVCMPPTITVCVPMRMYARAFPHFRIFNNTTQTTSTSALPWRASMFSTCRRGSCCRGGE